MASLMIEKYLRGKISRLDLEKRMLEGSLQGEYDKYIRPDSTFTETINAAEIEN